MGLGATLILAVCVPLLFESKIVAKMSLVEEQKKAGGGGEVGGGENEAKHLYHDTGSFYDITLLHTY